MTVKSWEIQDSRKCRSKRPLPKPDQIGPLEGGHRVKLMFKTLHQPSSTATELLTVEILLVNGNQFLGQLEENPEQIDGLVKGEMIEFEEHHIYEID